MEARVFGKKLEGRGYVPILRPSFRDVRKGVMLVLPNNEHVEAWQTTPGEIFLSWTTHMTATELAQTSVGDEDTDVTVTSVSESGRDSTNDRVIDYLGRIDSSLVRLEKAGYPYSVVHAVGYDTQTVVMSGSGLNATGEDFFPLPATIARTGTPIVSKVGPYVMDRILPIVQWED